MLIYGRDGQLKVTRGPIFRKLKSSGPEHGKQKKRSFKIYILNSIYFVYTVIIQKGLLKIDFAISLEIIYEANKLDCCEVVAFVITFCCD